MDKLLLLHITKLTYVLLALTDYDIDFAYHKKSIKLSLEEKKVTLENKWIKSIYNSKGLRT